MVGGDTFYFNGDVKVTWFDHSCQWKGKMNEWYFKGVGQLTLKDGSVKQLRLPKNTKYL